MVKRRLWLCILHLSILGLLCPMIDWSKINTVFLDLDGTLLDLHFDNHFWLISSHWKSLIAI